MGRGSGNMIRQWPILRRLRPQLRPLSRSSRTVGMGMPEGPQGQPACCCACQIARDTYVPSNINKHRPSSISSVRERLLAGTSYQSRIIRTTTVRLKRAWSTALLVGWRYLNHASECVCTVQVQVSYCTCTCMCQLQAPPPFKLQHLTTVDLTLI